MGYLLAVLAVFLWSLNPIISNYFASSLAPLEMAFGRWLTAGIILIILARRDLWQNRRWFIGHIAYLLALAVSGMVITNTLIYYAGHTASAINISLINTLGPVFLLLLSHFILQTVITGRQISGLLVAFAGVLTIIVNGDFLALSKIKLVRGDFIMLINAFCFAVYSLLQTKRPPEISQTSLLAASAVVGVGILFVLMLLFVPEAQFVELRPADYGVFVYLGIFNSVLAYLSWNTALHKLGNIKTAVVYYALPLFSTAEAWIILGERLHLPQIIGGTMIIAGIAWANFAPAAKALKKAPVKKE